MLDLLDVLDCGDADKVGKRAELYKGYGLALLLSQPLRLFLPIAALSGLVEA
ncbi:hypothetical protein D3C86_273410 [compost metagenome]